MTGTGHVSVFEFDAVDGDDHLRGDADRRPRPASASDDAGRPRPDDDHKPDHLLVGAPPTHAYLYSLPLATGAAPVAIADR